MKRKLQALAVLLLFAAIKLPLEQRVTQDLRQQRMLQEPLRLGVGEDLGQAGLAASLGGLRGLAAAIFQLKAHVEFTRVNWAAVDSLYKLITRLQPRNPTYWDEASWHMAFNAASYYLYNQDLKPALRGQLYDEHVQRGVDILKEGLHFLPNNPRLWEKLADIHYRRTHDFQKSGDAFLQAYENGGLNYTERFAGYAYAQSNDFASWQKGYTILRRLYDRGQVTPGLVEFLKILERNLNIPAARRVPDAAPLREGPGPMTGPRR